jgi:hypothetical protein
MSRISTGGAPVPAAAAGTPFGVHIDDFGAVGDSTTDDSAAFMEAHAALDVNRGGHVILGPKRYRIGPAQAVLFSKQGTVLLGEGMPGTKRSDAQGSSRIIVDDGLTGITCDTGGHGTLGFGFENVHVIAATGATTGNGILISNAVRTYCRNVTVSDFIGGYGMRLDGETGNAQYAHLDNFGAGDCLTGLHLMGTGPNGLRMLGGYLEGNSDPRNGSVGIHIETGDTAKLFGPVVSGYETGIYVQSAGQSHEVHGLRSEYNNIGIRIGGSTKGVLVLGGNWNNNLLTGGGSNVGIQVDAGAANAVLLPGFMDTTVTTKVSDAGTDTLYWTNNGTQPLVFFPGSVGVNNPTATHLGSGVGVLPIKNADTVPSTNPTGGGVMYVEAGALKYRGASGTVTTLGPA